MGNVSITGAAEDQFVTLRVMSALSCVDAAEPGTSNLSYGEVASLNVLNGFEYAIPLTEGSYDAHAAIYDDASQLVNESVQTDVEISKDTETRLNLPF